jgi:hypothetical protein
LPAVEAPVLADRCSLGRYGTRAHHCGCSAGCVMPRTPPTRSCRRLSAA